MFFFSFWLILVWWVSIAEVRDKVLYFLRVPEFTLDVSYVILVMQYCNAIRVSLTSKDLLES
jgi:hypothetical protein